MCIVLFLSGKYGRNAGLPFLRPPLTAALLTLGKAHQVTINAVIFVRSFTTSMFVDMLKSSVNCFCCNPTERHGRERTRPPEPPPHAARAAAAPSHQR